MCDPAQMLVSYTIHPHVEMRSTGRSTAKILQRMMSGDATPQTLRAHSLMFEEANGWRTDMRPMIKLQAMARAFEMRNGVFTFSIDGAFPCADIADVMPTVQHSEIARQNVSDIGTRCSLGSMNQRPADQ